MNLDFYTFKYDTKTRRFKRISYSACSFSSAWKRFRRNVHFTLLINVYKNGELYA